MHRVTGGDPLLFEARENVLGAYQQLRDSHPAFPEVLRDFQVIKSTTNSSACTQLPLQADIVTAAINAEDGDYILQPANRHGQDIAYDRRQLPPPTRCAGFFFT